MKKSEGRKEIDYLTWGWRVLFLLPVPHIPLIFLTYPLSMHPDDWLENIAPYALTVDYWLLFVAAILFYLAGKSQAKIYYILCATCACIWLAMTLYIVMVG